MSPRIDARQRKSTRLIGLVLVSTLVCFPRAEVHSQDCAPPAGAQKSCAAPARQPMCRPRSRPRSRSYIEDQEFERRLAEEVAAAVAEATLQSERERQGATGGATATAEFSSPPPSGVVAGATNSVGIRGLEVTFPEWKLALPSVQLPALVRLRRDAEMLLDSGRATLVRNGGGVPEERSGARLDRPITRLVPEAFLCHFRQGLRGQPRLPEERRAHPSTQRRKLAPHGSVVCRARGLRVTMSTNSSTTLNRGVLRPRRVLPRSARPEQAPDQVENLLRFRPRRMRQTRGTFPLSRLLGPENRWVCSENSTPRVRSCRRLVSRFSS